HPYLNAAPGKPESIDSLVGSEMFIIDRQKGDATNDSTPTLNGNAEPGSRVPVSYSHMTLPTTKAN
ncbi:hypothetical protein ACN0IV_21610, partial [Trabulsiella odontotermitis]|uniref:hypothetical protein n=1 Tax=Trabulsiella odontotermitis TaxID=379893 RepID=UPI003AC5DEDD